MLEGICYRGKVLYKDDRRYDPIVWYLAGVGVRNIVGR